MTVTRPIRVKLPTWKEIHAIKLEIGCTEAMAHDIWVKRRNGLKWENF